MEPIIRIRSLSKIYTDGWRRSEVVALEGISLELSRGQVLGVFGGNGSGKSTLLKMICGLSEVTSGTIKIDGLDPMSAVLAEKIGFLPERAAYPGDFTPERYLEFLGKLGGLSSEELRLQVEACLKRCKLLGEENKPIRKLSKGFLQRLALAQALIHNPAVVVLDEPLDGMDPLAREHFLALVEELKFSGKTVVVSTHITEGFETMCDQVLVLHDGKSLFIGSPDFEGGFQAWFLECLKEVEVPVA